MTSSEYTPEISIEKEMKKSYLDYAMSVIIGTRPDSNDPPAGMISIRNSLCTVNNARCGKIRPRHPFHKSIDRDGRIIYEGCNGINEFT